MLSVECIASRSGYGRDVDAPRTARERGRAELTRAIKDAARAQLAEHGAAALSLRAVARDLGMASSALYRYFASRDELLTALIIDAYDDLGATCEEADREAVGLGPGRRWLAVGRALRGWALAHPHEFALVYGSPVPGYAAPTTTVEPATRLVRVLAGVVRDAAAAGELRPPRRPLPGPRVATDAVAAVVEGELPEASADLLERSLAAWTLAVSTVTFELFGHLHGAVTDYGDYFDLAMTLAAETVGLDVDAAAFARSGSLPEPPTLAARPARTAVG